MATSVISANDLTKLRANEHYFSDIRLNVFEPDIVTTLTVSATPTDNPASDLTVTGDLSNVEIGQRYIIRDASQNIVTHGTVRLSPSGSEIFINPVSIGDSGFVSESGIHRPIESGNTLIVYKDRPLWGDYSRIVGSNNANAFRKRWQLSYSDQNEDTPPIANTGASQSATVTVGSSASFQLPRFGSNTSFAFGSKTISTYSWTLPTGVTLKAGYALTDSVIEVDAVAGQHVIDLTVTDSNGKTDTAHCYLFVDDGQTYKNLFDSHLVRIDSDSQDLDGRTITFTAIGDDLSDVIYPCSYIHLQHEMLFDGSQLTDGVDVDTFVGYVTDYRFTHDGNYGRATITCVSPYVYAQRIFMPSQLITEVANPNNWTQVTTDLSNPRGALQYIRWQCQNLFRMHDIDAPYTTPRKLSYEYNASTIGSGLDVSAQAILGNVGSASDGTIVLRKNPNFEDNTFRNNLAVGMTFTATDILPPFEYPLSVPPPYASVKSGAFIYDGTLSARYGVKRWGQGTSETVLPDFTVTASEGLDGILAKVGHLYADQNKPDETSITMNRQINVIDPVYMIWYAIDVDSSFDPSGQDQWNNIRILPRRVNRTWDSDNETLTIQTTFKRETFGLPADEWVVGSAQTVTSGSWSTSPQFTYNPNVDQLGILPNIAVAVNDSGDGAYTSNFTDLSPTWVSLNSFVNGNICDVAWDYNSAFITNGGLISDPFSMYILSASGSTLYVYRVFDIKASTLQVDEITTYTMDDSSTTTSARIQCSADNATLVLVAWHDQTGVQVGRSTDGGSTWSSNIQIGSAITDTDNDNEEIGLYLSGSNQIVTAPDGASDYGTYLATTDGGAFSEITGTIRNTAPNQMITGDNDTTLYVSTNNNGSGTPVPDYNIDFDGGDPYVSLDGGAGFNSGDTATGNGGGNAAFSQYSIRTGALSNQRSYLLINFNGGTANAGEVVDIEFDVYFDVDFAVNSFFGGTVTQDIEQGILIRDGGSTYSETDIVVVDTDTQTGAGTPYTFTNNTTWITNTLTATVPAGKTATVYNVWIAFPATGLSGIPPTGAQNNLDIVSQSEIRIDNIKLYIGGSTPTIIDPKLYRVTTYTTSPTWTDITPATDSIPRLPYGLGIDIADTNNIEVASTDGTTPKWFSSANTGTSYTDNGASDYRTFKRVGDVIFAGGNNTVALSIDGGTSFESKNGNLDVTMSNGISDIKQLLVFA